MNSSIPGRLLWAFLNLPVLITLGNTVLHRTFAPVADVPMLLIFGGGGYLIGREFDRNTPKTRWRGIAKAAFVGALGSVVFMFLSALIIKGLDRFQHDPYLESPYCDHVIIGLALAPVVNVVLFPLAFLAQSFGKQALQSLWDIFKVVAHVGSTLVGRSVTALKQAPRCVIATPIAFWCFTKAAAIFPFKLVGECYSILKSVKRNSIDYLPFRFELMRGKDSFLVGLVTFTSFPGYGILLSMLIGAITTRLHSHHGDPILFVGFFILPIVGFFSQPISCLIALVGLCIPIVSSRAKIYSLVIAVVGTTAWWLVVRLLNHGW